MKKLTLFFLALGAVFFAAAATGQVAEPAPEAVDAADQLVGWLIRGVPLLVMLCSAIASFVPSTNKLMKVVDAFAFNWHKARNNPERQKWGS